MSKEVRFSSDARKAMLKGVNILGDDCMCYFRT